MTGDGDDGGDGQSDEVIAGTLDEILAGDNSGLCAGLLDVLALLPGVGAARWVLHRAGDLALAAAPGGYGVHEVFAPEVVDAALAELAEAGLLAIDEAVFDDAGDDGDVAGDEDAGEPDDLDEDDQDDRESEDGDREEDYLDDSAFDTVTAVADAARIILARHVAAGTLAELGGRVCVLLGEAARSGAGIDSALLADGMTACWDHLRPCLGPADGELVKDLLAMRNAGLYSLLFYPDATEAAMIGFGEKLLADYEQALGPGHQDAWEARSNIAYAYGRCPPDPLHQSSAHGDRQPVLPRPPSRRHRGAAGRLRRRLDLPPQRLLRAQPRLAARPLARERRHRDACRRTRVLDRPR
jgi:hypothetical protein